MGTAIPESSTETQDATAPSGTVSPNELPLPACITRRTDGIYVDPIAAGIERQFARFVERVFAEGIVFVDLDYANFLHLIFEETPPNTHPDPLRLAKDLAVFTEQRRTLYRAVKIAPNKSSADYMFEPVHLDVPDEAGGPARQEPARLSFDEFVAHLWLNGVRFGIHEKAVRQAIAKGETGRIEVAHEREPTPGEDARLIEESDALHRDNSPKRLANGNIDLGQFSNRYPQVSKGTALLRKAPRAFGKPGFKVSGDEVMPEAPADFDLAKLVGPGTEIEHRGGNEVIVATMNGFLNLDTQSSLISITEKIVSHDGVSLRTTGNLLLRGEDYEEFGEVQEKRTVEGKNMTFHANVYGNLISNGGTIHLHQNLSGGKATSAAGKVIIDGRASASVIEVPDGEAHIKYAEGCTIFADHVVVEQAVLCQIIANTVEIAHSEGCAIGGKHVSIGNAGMRKDVETIVVLFVPDFSDIDAQYTELDKQHTELASKRDQLQKQTAATQQQPELANFMALQGKIKRGEIKLSPSQQEGLKRAAAQIAPQLQQLKTLGDAQNALKAALDAVDQKRNALDQQCQAMGANIQCTLDNVSGDTIVRTTSLALDVFSSDDTLQVQMAGLRGTGEPKDRLFNNDTGSFAWHYAEDQAQPSASSAQTEAPSK